MNLLDYDTPGGYEAITVGDTPIGLTASKINVGRQTMVVLSVETEAVRFRCDGGDPSATDGVTLASGTVLELQGKLILNNLKFHQTSSGASVKVQYFHHL